MSSAARRTILGLTFSVAVAVAVSGCGPSFIAVRPTEPLATEARGVHVDVTRMWLTDEVRDRGLGEDIDLVVELRVRNDGARERKVSPGSLSCWMVLDAQRPGETLSLLAGGGGEGAYPGVSPAEGSMLLPVSIPPGQSRDLWAIFHGYRFDGSDRRRRVTLTVPLDDGTLALDLADPARGGLRWEAPPQREGLVFGLRNLALFGGGLHASVPGAELTFAWRRGPVMWDLGLTSSLLVQTQGPLQSVTSSFSGVGLVAHLTVPFASWGASEDPRQLSFFAGGSTSGLVEVLTSAVANMNSMTRPPVHTYGFDTVEAGLELDMGALRFAGTPFPLAPSKRSLPRWAIRVGYVQGWSGGATGGGLLENLRFSF